MEKDYKNATFEFKFDKGKINITGTDVSPNVITIILLNMIFELLKEDLINASLFEHMINGLSEVKYDK